MTATDPSTLSSPERARRRFALFLALAYCALLTLLMLHHEPWRDELQPWILARDSASLAELAAHVRYEGQPLLWYLILYPLTRLTPDPWAMQALQLLIATAVVYVVARRAPFPGAAVVALALGYFFVFEYALLSRPYALGALLLFAACALLPRRVESYLWLALPLALLANTTAHGVMAAFAFTVALLVELALSPTLRRAALARRGRTIAAAAILVIGGVAGAWQVRPPADAPFRGRPVERASAVDAHAIGATGALVWAAYVPLAQGGREPVWGANVLLTGERATLALALLLSLLLACAVGVLTIRKPVAFTFYVVSHGVLLAAAYTLFVGYTRHYGHLWLFALASLWLARTSTVEWRLPPWLDRLATYAERRWLWLVAPILLLQVAAAAQHLQRAVREPFSSLRHAARAAESSARTGEPIIVLPDYLGPGVSSALRRPVWLAELGREGSFVPSRTAGQRVHVEPGRELERVLPLLATHGSVIVIANRQLAERSAEPTVEELAAFPRAFERYERAWVYRVSAATR